LAPQGRDSRANVERIVDVVVANPSADLAVFPELFLSGYELTDLDELASEAVSRVGDIQEVARKERTGVIVGTPWPVAGGVTNAALCISSDGELRGRYDKTHLFGAEKEAFRAGGDLLLVEMDGSRVGILICFDLEFPEPARLLALAGADLLVAISANMRPYFRDHRVFCAARAIENRLPLIYVNRVGRESGFVFAGGSRLMDAEGCPRAQMSSNREEVAVVSLPSVAAVPAVVDYLRQIPDGLQVRR
jgi:predicted amidohydrolase